MTKYPMVAVQARSGKSKTKRGKIRGATIEGPLDNGGLKSIIHFHRPDPGKTEDDQGRYIPEPPPHEAAHANVDEMLTHLGTAFKTGKLPTKPAGEPQDKAEEAEEDED